MFVHLGIDDLDSWRGGCTTYVASFIVEYILKEEGKFIDYPNLVRLNPNIPWKTRGNGAVALRLYTMVPERLFHYVSTLVLHESSVEGANPGVVMLISENIPSDITTFSTRTLHQVVSRRQAFDIIQRHGLFHFGVGNQMGIVGALAAIGNQLLDDYTYELIAYREEDSWGKPRRVDKESVFQMAEQSYPNTYNNYDSEKSRILITPRSADPLLLGIRGEEPHHVLAAYRMVKIDEPVGRYMIFRTNQGTDAHLVNTLNLRRLKAYSSGHFTGVVSEKPSIAKGGHVFFKVNNMDSQVVCAVYEPTGSLRTVALNLLEGDMVELGGGVRRRTVKHPTAFNVEYLRILNLVDRFEYRNPHCTRCGKKMDSQGCNQGYRCKRCGLEIEKVRTVSRKMRRVIVEGLYLPPPRAHRHLTKPLQRYGRDKRWYRIGLIDDWYWFSSYCSRNGNPTISTAL